MHFREEAETLRYESYDERDFMPSTFTTRLLTAIFVTGMLIILAAMFMPVMIERIVLVSVSVFLIVELWYRFKNITT